MRGNGWLVGRRVLHDEGRDALFNRPRKHRRAIPSLLTAAFPLHAWHRSISAGRLSLSLPPVVRAVACFVYISSLFPQTPHTTQLPWWQSPRAPRASPPRRPLAVRNCACVRARVCVCVCHDWPVHGIDSCESRWGESGHVMAMHQPAVEESHRFMYAAVSNLTHATNRSTPAPAPHHNQQNAPAPHQPSTSLSQMHGTMNGRMSVRHASRVSPGSPFAWTLSVSYPPFQSRNKQSNKQAVAAAS